MLEILDLTVSTSSGRELLHGIDLQINAGQRVGLIGESGSGKSLTALSIMGLLAPNLHAQGNIRFDGEELLGASENHLATLRGSRVSMIFQEPMTALNPLMTVGKQVAEALRIHGHTSGSQKRVLELFQDVGLPEPTRIYTKFPHELSGGQRQRVLIAIALANDPELLLCDEPTTALDVTVQAQIVQLILRLAEKHNIALLFITHDLALVSQVCEELVVMHDGRIVESGPLNEVLGNPQHEYTQGLTAASDLRARNSEGKLYTVKTALDGTYRPGFAHARPERPSPGSVVATGSGLGRVYSSGGWFRKHETIAVQDVDFELRDGERLGLVGGSGSGKSTLLRIIAGLDKPTTGSLDVQGRTAMVFQDPMGSLDPRMTIADAVSEPLLKVASSQAERMKRVREVLDEVGIGADALARYPHEFSGGQRQRISIARALAARPDILLADEPVSALDVSVRATVLNLLEDLVNSYGLSMIFVSHDLGVIREICTNVMVMSNSRVVESGTVNQIYSDPQHPDTAKLLAAIPRLETSQWHGLDHGMQGATRATFS